MDARCFLIVFRSPRIRTFYRRNCCRFFLESLIHPSCRRIKQLSSRAGKQRALVRASLEHASEGANCWKSPRRILLFATFRWSEWLNEDELKNLTTFPHFLFSLYDFLQFRNTRPMCGILFSTELFFITICWKYATSFKFLSFISRNFSWHSFCPI